MYKLFKALLIFLFFGALMAACGSSGGGNPPSPTPLGKIIGKVLDGTTGQAVSDAKVSAEGESTKTAADGSYTLSDLAISDRVIVTISRPGFADQSKVVRISNEIPEASLPVSVLSVGLTETFDPETQQTLSDTNTPASIILSADSLSKADGSAPEGNVTIRLTAIDPTVDIGLMPGDMQADTGGGTLSPIESFGAITATFTDEMDNDLNLASGSTATIRIPLADKSGTPPQPFLCFFMTKPRAYGSKREVPCY